MPTHRTPLGAIAALSLITGTALAGPDVIESGEDAGSDPDSSKRVTQSSVDRTGGSLDGASALAGPSDGDFEDMYLVFIPDPLLFSASTQVGVGIPGFETEFDTNLWMFFGPNHPVPEGTGLLGNTDSGLPPGGGGSILLPQATDGGVGLTDPGLYYIAISGGPGMKGTINNVPVSDDGLIFQFQTPLEISSADGMGGGSPIAAWTNTMQPQVGRYSILLEGVTGIPCPEDLNYDGQVNVDDLILVVINWSGPGTTSTRGDANGDGLTDVDDLIAVIMAWGPCETDDPGN